MHVINRTMNSSIILVKGALNYAIARFKQNFFRTMSSDDNYSYTGAIHALNGLQSNYAYLQKARERRASDPNFNLTNTVSHLHSLGISIESLNSLNVIHVSGTKGKGSTCAFSESILRHHGFKTGFYSSPHLISVNERIRINGTPLDKEVFSRYFSHVYETLQKSLENMEPMPSYFMFLTIMCYYVFIKEKVDVAIVEVGIGGLYDCTNVIKKPVCVGVTTLDLDHVHLLGSTLTDIAKQKAGIFKQAIPAFTVPQPKSAMIVLEQTAQSINCSLSVVPPFVEYHQQSTKFDFGLLGRVHDVNASLAVQLTKTWLSSIEPRICTEPALNLSAKFVEGLRSCSWPGRFQTVKKNEVTFYVDGAHVEQSIRHCIKWFEVASQQELSMSNKRPYRVLLFNATGQRDVETLLQPLSVFPFNLAIFCPNKLKEVQDASSDQSNFMTEPGADLKKCIQNQSVWHELLNNFSRDKFVQPNTEMNQNVSSNGDHSNSKVFSCLRDAMNYLQDDLINQHPKIQVLVTGSLHLVGGVLSIISPVI